MALVELPSQISNGLRFRGDHMGGIVVFGLVKDTHTVGALGNIIFNQHVCK